MSVIVLNPVSIFIGLCLNLPVKGINFKSLKNLDSSITLLLNILLYIRIVLSFLSCDADWNFLHDCGRCWLSCFSVKKNPDDLVLLSSSFLKLAGGSSFSIVSDLTV